MSENEMRQKIIDAGWESVNHLIEVAKEKIITGDEEKDLSADRLKNAAATKKLAIFDAFEIVKKIEEEQIKISGEEEKPKEENKKKRRGIAERIASSKDE